MKHKIIIAITFIFSAYMALGQNSVLIENAANKSIRSKTTSPFGAGSLSNLVSNVSVSSFFKEGVNGKIELQGKFNNRLSGGLTIDQKISKNSKVATPIDLTGISPGTTVKINFQKMFWKPSFKMSDAEVAALNIVTHAYEARKGLATNQAGLLEISKNGTDDEKKAAAEAFSKISFKEPAFINIDFGFTKTSFSYTTDSFSLKESKDDFVTPTLTISLIKILGKGFNVTGYAAISYNYSESYTSADDVTFTMPFGTSNNYYTSTLAFSVPKKETSHNVKVEFRKNLFTKNSNNFAISPSIILGINSKKLSMFLPVYFIKAADDKGKLISGLQGGVRLGYTTSTESGKVSNFKNGFIAQLIISQPLDFLSKL